MARRKDPVVPDAILDHLLAGADAKTALNHNGLLDQLKKALTERALKAVWTCAEVQRSYNEPLRREQ